MFDEPTVRSYPRGSLVAEQRMAASGYEDQILNWWHHLTQRAANPQNLNRLEAGLVKEQREWVELFIAHDRRGQAIINPHLPLAHVFLDDQCPVFVAAWGPAAPTCAVMMLVNELPANGDELSAQLDQLRSFVHAGPPGCVGVALYSAVSRLGVERFEKAATFTVEDPAMVLRAAVSVDHTKAARRYYAGRVALPVALVGVGNGVLQPRSVKEYMTKSEFTRRPNAHLEIRDIINAPVSHLGTRLWHRLEAFSRLVERREVTRVAELLADYGSKRQFARGIDTRLADFTHRAERELAFTLGWNPEILSRVLVEGTAPIQQAFSTWREQTAANERTAKKAEVRERIAVNPRRTPTRLPRTRPVTPRASNIDGLGTLDS